MQKSAYITNLASFLPNEPVGNDEIEKVLGMVGGKPSRARRIILKSNGIKSRHYVLDPETREPVYTNAQLTAHVIRSLENEYFSINDIDCMACGTTMGDQLCPNHAVMVHGELKNPPCEVAATAGICLSGMSAMKYAYNGVMSGDYQHAVVSGSENGSIHFRSEFFEEEIEEKVRQLEKKPELAFEKDFLRWMLSDGAGAALIEPEPRPQGVSLKIEWIDMYSFANELETCMYCGCEKMEDGSIKGWGRYFPGEWAPRSILSIKQDVKLLNEHIVDYAVEKTLDRVIAKRGIKAEEVDYFLPHMSSHYFQQKIMDKLEEMNFVIPAEKWYTNLAERGNTGSASIYIMLDEIYRSERLKDGQKILCFIPESGRFSSCFMLLTVVEK